MPSPPRRSTRSAAPVASSSAKTSTTNSSASSITSSRPQRNAHKDSPTPTSLAPPDTDNVETTATKPTTESSEPTSRRAKRNNSAPTDPDPSAQEPKPDVQAAAADQEADVDSNSGDITRCVCGNIDYPGPPINELTNARSDLTEDTGALFIQCDTCSVWQHGGCVGLMDEDKTPDNYYCEICNSRSHTLGTDSRGQAYSIYVPVAADSPKPDDKAALPSPIDTTTPKEREPSTRNVLDSASARRRATMNSRTVYDEEEEFRKAIERSKAENETKGAASRKTKRSRTDSDDTNQDNKRQRTASDPDDMTSSNHNSTSVDNYSADERDTTRRKSKNAASAKSKEAKDRERVDAADRRKNRAERRRPGDTTDTIDNKQDASEAGGSAELNLSQETPDALLASPATKSAGGARKGKRGVRGQQSLEKSIESPVLAATNEENSADEDGADQADVKPREDPENDSTPVPTAASNTKSKASRFKGKQIKTAPPDADSTFNSKDKDDSDSPNTKEKDKSSKSSTPPSIKDMDKATQYMLEYINARQPTTNGVTVDVNHTNAQTIQNGQETAESKDVREYDSLSSNEMAARLRREILAWRTEFAQDGLSSANGSTGVSGETSTEAEMQDGGLAHTAPAGLTA